MDLRSIRFGSDVPDEFVTHFINVAREQNEAKKAWCDRLMAEGFAAAHPNDGWVDRVNNKFQLCYPFFELKVGVGDKVMLGSHYDFKTERPVIVTKIERSMFGLIHYYFQDMP